MSRQPTATATERAEARETKRIDKHLAAMARDHKWAWQLHPLEAKPTQNYNADTDRWEMGAPYVVPDIDAEDYRQERSHYSLRGPLYPTATNPTLLAWRKDAELWGIDRDTFNRLASDPEHQRIYREARA